MRQPNPGRTISSLLRNTEACHLDGPSAVLSDHVGRGFIVKAYRVYFVDRGAHIARPPVVVECKDEEVVQKARQFIDGLDVELWQGDRLDARFPHELRCHRSGFANLRRDNFDFLALPGAGSTLPHPLRPVRVSPRDRGSLCVRGPSLQCR